MNCCIARALSEKNVFSTLTAIPEDTFGQPREGAFRVSKTSFT